ncbi:MAG: hypothetical protein PUK86_07755, partial [bacterium]|nr:hypothetical protein [bacterium]
DGEASSPARCRASNLRFEPSAVSPKAKPENPKGFQPSCHPHQSPLKIEDFSGAEPAGKQFFSLENGIYKNRPVPTLYICTARVGNADRSFPGNPGKSEKSAAPIYGGWFRVLSGGSRWQSALPTGSNWNRALPGRKGCGLLELSRVF